MREAWRVRWRAAWHVGWLLAPLALVSLPTRWLAATPNMCLIRRVTGRPCPGCGMTRALSRLAHADPRGAWRYNARVTLAAPLLIAMWARSLPSTMRALRGALGACDTFGRHSTRVLGWW